jgi:hypothetical protein
MGQGSLLHLDGSYETKNGAKVLAAGAFTLAGSIRQQPVARLLDNMRSEILARPV